jgi:hypothetical protein
VSISKKIRGFIVDKISSLFDSIKRAALSLSGDSSFASLYKDAYRSASGSSEPDQEQIKDLVDSTERYLDALKLKTVSSAIDACQKAPKGAREVRLSEQISKSFDHLDMIVATQAQTFQNLGALDGILDSSGKHNDEEPFVYFTGPNDSKTCKTCKEMYFLKDGVTPRVWKVSELGTGFFKKGDCCPSVSPIHPRCRHFPTYLPKGHGFVGGKVQFVSDDFDPKEGQD